jgi:acetylglutamate kinase
MARCPAGCCRKISSALIRENGVNTVHIIDGRVPRDAARVLTEQAYGTMIRSR